MSSFARLGMRGGNFIGGMYNRGSGYRLKHSKRYGRKVYYRTRSNATAAEVMARLGPNYMRWFRATYPDYKFEDEAPEDYLDYTRRPRTERQKAYTEAVRKVFESGNYKSFPQAAAALKSSKAYVAQPKAPWRPDYRMTKPEYQFGHGALRANPRYKGPYGPTDEPPVFVRPGPVNDPAFVAEIQQWEDPPRLSGNKRGQNEPSRRSYRVRTPVRSFDDMMMFD